MRLDAARRLDVLRRQHEAVVATTDEALRTSRDLLRSSTTRAVVVHRNPWFTRKLSDALASEGIDVLAQLDNGADAVGMVVAEQPDLLLLEDPLPMMTAEQVVHEVRTYSPHTFVAVQADTGAIGQLLSAGAGSVFTRQITPVSLARDLADVLHTRT
jgi:CheY-like chemotaxis protein